MDPRRIILLQRFPRTFEIVQRRLGSAWIVEVVNKYVTVAWPVPQLKTAGLCGHDDDDCLLSDICEVNTEKSQLEAYCDSQERCHGIHSLFKLA